MSYDNGTSFSTGWNPEHVPPFTDDDAQTVVQGPLDPSSSLYYGKDNQSESALFDADSMNWYCSSTNELESKAVFDQDYASFAYNL